MPPSTPLDREETAARIEKLRLERRKLILDVSTAERTLSWHGTCLEWLKAATVPAALLGVFVTFLIGSSQLRQTQDARDSERFDKALSRLAALNVSERLTGVAGLRLFLDPHDRARHAPALQFLVSALAIEENDVVQNAIYDTIRGLEKGTIAEEALSAALETAIKVNRATAIPLSYDVDKRGRPALIDKISTMLNLPKEQVSSKVGYPSEDNGYSGQLSFEQLASLNEISADPFDDKDNPFAKPPAVLGRLEAVERILE